METDMTDMNGFIKRKKSDEAVRHGHKNMINLQMNDILSNEKSVIIIIIRYKNTVEQNFFHVYIQFAPSPQYDNYVSHLESNSKTCSKNIFKFSYLF